MGEGGQEEDGGVGEEGLEDATVPAGGEAKQKAGEEHGGKDCCYHLQFFAIPNISLIPIKSSNIAKCRCQCKPFPKYREKAGGKDELEPWSKRGSKISELSKINL